MWALISVTYSGAIITASITVPMNDIYRPLALDRSLLLQVSYEAHLGFIEKYFRENCEDPHD